MAAAEFVPLYIVNQTQLSMMDCWISYVRKNSTDRQSFYVSTPIPVGPTLTFIGNIEVPTSSTNDGADTWLFYWREESNSLNGLSAPLQANVDYEKGPVSLYVVGNPNIGEQIIRVNQEGQTSGHAPWKTLLPISTETDMEEQRIEDPSVHKQDR